MIKKKILGIYAERDSLHYVSVTKGISGYALKSPGESHNPHEIRHGNGYALLRALLTELAVDSSMSIYLALPRSELFTREIHLPLMPVEDALMSIKNSLAIYSHLAPDSIYYDLIVSERNGGAFHALLVYAAKDEMEKYRKLFSETGHESSLKGIFPLSYGVCALMDEDAERNGNLFSLVQDDIIEFFVRSGKTLIFSTSCPVDSSDEKEMILNAVQSQFPQFKGLLNELSSDSTTIADPLKQDGASRREDSLALIDQTGMAGIFGHSRMAIDKSRKIKTGKKRKLSYLPPFKTNYASAALAPCINKIQQISLDGQPVKVNIVHPFRYIVPFLSILILALYFVTAKIERQSAEATSALKELAQQVKTLENGLEPLQNKIDTLKKASRFKTDVKEFMQTRPPIYTVINEIATLVPDGTWFANFTFNERVITLRGTGSDALKTVEALRSSDIFDNVMLRGSVNRRGDGEENFTLVLELKSEQMGGEFKKETIQLKPVNPSKKSLNSSGGVQ